MRKVLALVLSALVLSTTGCLLIGFDQLDDDAAGGAGASDGAGSGGAGGSAGTSPTGGAGVSGNAGMAGSGARGGAVSSGGSGGVVAAGTGGSDPDASIADDGGVLEPDAGPPTACTGKPDGTPCDDGAYCTDGDRCVSGACAQGAPIKCGDDCNDSLCNELLDTCTAVPVSGNCGTLGVCIDGECDAALYTCGLGRTCKPLCRTRECVFDCKDTRSCEPTCRDAADCVTDCNGAETCDFECSQDSTCVFDCTQTGTCTGRCDGASRCEVQCAGSANCGDFECLNESECRIHCPPLQSCSFAECWDEPQECGPGVVICGSDCSDW